MGRSGAVSLTLASAPKLELNAADQRLYFGDGLADGADHLCQVSGVAGVSRRIAKASKHLVGDGESRVDASRYVTEGYTFCWICHVPEAIAGHRGM